MPRKVVRKERGVFEKVPGSNIWWIRFKVAGVEHREKVGRRGDAIKLYKIRKADILRGVKMPANMKDKGIRFSVLAQEAIDWYVNHDRKDVRNFKGRMKFILEAFADRVADEIKPSDIDLWISSHKWSAATKNRYKNVFGKTFKIALADGKVTSNPARMVEQRAENNARIRFLSANEEERLRAAIKKRFEPVVPAINIRSIMVYGSDCCFRRVSDGAEGCRVAPLAKQAPEGQVLSHSFLLTDSLLVDLQGDAAIRMP
jgi:hypothetical protein